MSIHRFLAAASIAAMAVAMAALSSPAAADEAAGARGDEPNPFEGKYLMIRLDRALDEHAAYLKDARITKIGDDVFLAGTGFTLGAKSKWYAGRNVWLSLHHVEQMFVFDSMDEIEKMYEKDDE